MGSVEEKVRYSYHADATMKRVFFIPLYDSHIRVFMPLIKQLQAQNTTEPMVVFLERVHTDGLIRLLDGYSLPYIRVDLFPRSFKRGRKIHITDLRMRSMEKHMVTLFHTRKKIKDLFDSLDPAFIVVVNESYYADRFFLQEARQRGIPSLSLLSVALVSVPQKQKVSHPTPLKVEITRKLFGMVYSLLHRFWSNLLYLYRQIMIAFGLPLYYIGVPSHGQATKVCVWSELVKQEIVKSGGIPEKIVVTGSPAHDIIYYKYTYFGQKTINSIHKLLNIEKDKKIILFISQPLAKEGICSFEEQKRLTELVIETCTKFEGYFLVIKLHPREIAEDYGYINSHPLHDKFRLITDKEADLYDLIYSSRLVLTQSSTTGRDVVLFEKDLINIKLFTKAQIDYAEHGVALTVCDEGRLFETVEKALGDNNTQEELRRNRGRFIAEFFPEFDGKATDRVTELIFQMLKE